MIIAYHLMWTLYGWWLPNDPRGSTSKQVESDVLRDLGELHFGRKKVQPARKVIKKFYDEAADMLAFPLLAFERDQFAMVGAAIGESVVESRYTCWAMAVMPDHVHILIRKHRDIGEDMIEKIQVSSRSKLINLGMREPEHPVWTDGGWKVYLDGVEDVWRTIGYIEQNPVKRRWPVQRWGWVVVVL